MRSLHERWDETFAKLDRACPARRADEATVDYYRRLSVIGKRYLQKSEQITNVTFKTLPDDVVPKFSELVREAVERNLTRTDNMEPGTFRAVLRVDENTGQKIREYYGPRPFTDQFCGRIQKVLRINAPAQQTVWGVDPRRETAALW
jgi:hypothetical protein